MRAITVLSVLLAGAMMAPASAQTPPGPDVPQKLDPKACSDRERLQPDDTHETQGSAVPRDDPGNKLARPDGVVCPPPDIDPDVQRPAPDGGAMPVIPPPGSPGGDPSVRPK
jgi:hypothetical protein